MRIEIDLEGFETTHASGCQTRVVGTKTLLHSAGLSNIGTVDDLAQSEYGQAVELDADRRAVRFGRDYLGHYPLLYACTPRALYVSDEISWIVGRLKASGVRLTLHEEALALYFSMGYVPAGMTVFSEIVACEPHTVYQWRRGKIERTSTFNPVETDPALGLSELGSAIDSEVARLAGASDEIDVWCSGGIDSSIMACLFNAQGRRAELLTIGYGKDIHETHGDGERSYAYDVARHCGAPIREVDLAAGSFEAAHERFVSTHHMPVIDVCLPPKYALACASRSLVITGEGSDPLFGGPKNNAMLYAQSRGPSVDLGWHYAVQHDRSFAPLGKLMRRGAALSSYVVEQMNALLARYPGDLIRRLFYVNTHVKAAGLIFTESYHASRGAHIAVRHPYAGLAVYRAAFALEDHFKYRYPKSKIALHELYAGRLPRSVVERKKSGTLVPLQFYLRRFAASKFDLAPLHESGLFAEPFVRQLGEARDQPEYAMPLYGLVTLSEWLKHCLAEAGSPQNTTRGARSVEQRVSLRDSRSINALA
jgi:asparagine synthase (glutamine-hydrolysing)